MLTGVMSSTSRGDMSGQSRSVLETCSRTLTRKNSSRALAAILSAKHPSLQGGRTSVQASVPEAVRKRLTRMKRRPAATKELVLAAS